MTDGGDRTGQTGQAGFRDAILAASLTHVVFDGWTDRALREGAVAAGHEPGAAARAFPRGGIDAIAHFSDWADRRMLAALEEEAESFATLRVRDKITRAVRLRLELLEPHREAVRRAMTVLAMRGRAGQSARLLYRSVDAMWRAAGDTATDFNFYTKRGLLAGVQSATMLYWLGDGSEGHAATWSFLDRRIADVMRIGKAMGKMRGASNRNGGEAPLPLRLAMGLSTRLRSVAGRS